MLKPTIFRLYDIRGVYNEEFSAADCYRIGRAYAEHEAKKLQQSPLKMYITGDGRVSTPEILPYFITGLADGGADVHFGGMSPTPHNYWAVYHKKYPAACVVSASHNPAKYNGFKPHDVHGKVYGDECMGLYEKALAIEVPEDLDVNNWESRCTKVDYKQEYIEYLVSKCEQPKKFRVLVDAGNAVPGAWYPDLLRAAGHEVVELFCDIDGNFPNHQPDPLEPENAAHAQKAVVEYGCDFAFLYDGDGDRLGVVDSVGNIIPSRSVMAGVLFKDVVQRKPGVTVAMDVMSSLFLQEMITNWGGNPVLGVTGHAQMMECLHDNNAEMACEFSGHIMTQELHGYDDAGYATLVFLRAIAENPNIINEVREEIPTTTDITKYIAVDDAHKYETFEKMKQKLLELYPSAITLDGVRVNFGNSEWCILRCSNSTPCYKLRAEARTPEKAEQLAQQILDIMAEYIELKPFH